MGSDKAWSSVLCKLSIGKFEIPVCDALNHQAPKQSRKCLVGDVGLAISLWMAGGATQGLGADELS